MRRSIFYFDDEQGLLDLFKHTFDHAYEVHTATTLAEARRVLAQCDVDIIISDQVMPEIDGTEFLREAASICPHSFRIMVTGKVAVGGVLKEIRGGIIQLFVPKPWTIEQMRQILERASAAFGSRSQ